MIDKQLVPEQVPDHEITTISPYFDAVFNYQQVGYASAWVISINKKGRYTTNQLVCKEHGNELTWHLINFPGDFRTLREAQADLHRRVDQDCAFRASEQENHYD